MRTKFHFLPTGVGTFLFLLSLSIVYLASPAHSLPNLVGDCESELFNGLSDWDNGDDSTMMYDDGTHGDLTPNDSIYTLTVDSVVGTFSLTEVAGHQVVDTAGQWVPQFPGQNVPVEFTQGDTVTFYLDKHVYADGYVPESCIVYNSWMPTYSWPGPYYVVGSCQTAFGASGDWDQTDTTIKMNDAGLNGDVAAGDLIYTYRGVCTAAGDFEFKVLCSYNSWRPQFAQEGFVWDFGANIEFSTQSLSDTVTFESDARYGRTRVTVLSGLDTLNPRVESAIVVSWDTVLVTFSEPMDLASASNSSHYGLSPSLPFSVDFPAESFFDVYLVITGDSLDVGVTYTVTVDTLVKDQAGNPIDTLYDSATFGIAPVTFQVVDTVGQTYPGFLFKGSFDTDELHGYDDTWGMGFLYEMFDDGSHGDVTPGDNIWSRLVYLIADGGANTWEWGVTDTFENWIDGNWQFSVDDASSQILSFEPEQGTSQDVHVTFNLDMGGQTPASFAGGVSLEGSRFPLDWDGGNLPMADPDNDTIYTLTVTFPSGSYPWVDYKYTKSSDGMAWDWESIDNRTFKVDDTDDSLTLSLDCFNNECSSSDTAVTVIFTYNCESWADSIDHGVWLIGDQPPLVFGDPCPDTTHPMTDLGNWIYQLGVTFPKGTQKWVEFKAVIDCSTSCWDEAELPGWNRHFIIDDSDTLQILDTLYYDNTPPSGYACGDCNGDDRVTIADATYIVGYIYRGGPDPIGDADVNLDTRITIADATYLVAFIYRDGPPPCNPPLGYLPYSDESAVVSIEHSHVQNEMLDVSVAAAFDVPVAGLHLSITYNHQLLQPLKPGCTSRTEGLNLFCDPALKKGELALGMLSLTGSEMIQPGAGSVAVLRFKKLTDDADLSGVQIEEAILVDEESRALKTTVLGYSFGPSLPKVFSLSQNYPNPLVSGTDIRYALPKDVKVTVEVFNLLGEKVQTLVNRRETAGQKVVHWNGTNASGDMVAPGIYFYRIAAGSFRSTRKMLVLR